MAGERAESRENRQKENGRRSEHKGRGIDAMGETIIPLCDRCYHKATMHAVDDEELRECMEWCCSCGEFLRDVEFIE